MSHRARFSRLFLPILLTLGAVFMFLASTSSAVNIQTEWLQTPEAIARTQAGDCPVAGEDCWELCFRGNATGTFACYNTPPEPDDSGDTSPPSHA